MTVWRIPQCWGRLLGHTQGTPTVPRGPVPSSHSAPHDVFSGNARGPKLTLSPMECVRLCYRIKGGSHPFYHPAPSFTAGDPFYHNQFYSWYVPGVFVLTY